VGGGSPYISSVIIDALHGYGVVPQHVREGFKERRSRMEPDIAFISTFVRGLSVGE
jgi:hypothetical protein